MATLTVGTGVLDGPCIYYTTTENEIQYHTVSTFMIFFYGNIVTQDPFFPAHAAEAITFVYSDKSNQNRRKRTGRPLDSACLIAVAQATSKAYDEVYCVFCVSSFL